MAKQDFNFFHRLRVRWAEVDRQDIVFNGHYLTYFDLAMTEYLRAMGFPYPAGLLTRAAIYTSSKPRWNTKPRPTTTKKSISIAASRALAVRVFSSCLKFTAAMIC